MNHELKDICQWRQRNEVSLNGGKTNIIVKNKQQTITKDLNFKACGQKAHATNTMKYVGVYLNDSLTWHTHLTAFLPKLNRALVYLQKYVNTHKNSY